MTPVSSGNEVTFEGVGQDWGTVTHVLISSPTLAIVYAADTEPWEILFLWRKRPFPWVQHLLLFLSLVALVLWGTF